MSTNNGKEVNILFNSLDLKCYSKICKKPIKLLRICYLGEDPEFLNHFKDLKINYINISKELSSVADRIKYDFIDYIASIGQQKTNHVYWWATRLASKSNLQTDLFSIVCFLLVGKQLIDSKRCDLFVVNDYRIYFLIKNNFNCSSSLFSLIKAYGSRLNKLAFNIIKLFVSRIVWFLRTIIKNINDRKYLEEVIIKSNFIISFVEERSFDKNWNYVDPYLSGIEKFNLINQSILFMHSDVKSNFYPRLKLSKRIITGLSYYSSFSKLLQSCFVFFKIKFDPFFKGINYKLLFIEEIIRENCSSHLCYQIHDYKCWVEYFKNNRGNLIYPYENQPWEKIMILARDHVKGNINLIGYLHSTIPKNYLCYHTTEKELKIMPVPDVIIANSKINEKILKEYYSNKSNLKICNGGALRYPQKILIEKLNHRKKIGILLSSKKNHTSHLLENLNKISNLQFDVLVKPHPDFSFDNVNIGNSHTLFNGHAIDLYKVVDGIVYCSSTCGMEAYQYGLPVFRLSGQFIDLKFGEDSFKPKIIYSIDEISESDLVPHKPVQLFSAVDERIWQNILN